MRLIRTADGIIGFDGTSTVTIGVPSGVVWDVSTVTVSTTSTVRTTASVYLGSPTPGSLIDSTYSGNRDTSDSMWTAHGGEIITCVWTGGTPGSYTMFRVQGVQRP